MSLSEVEHQGFAQALIQRAIAGGRVPHAYLFHGPDGVGKEKFAHGLAQLLLCPDPIEKTLNEQAAKAVGVERIRTGCGECEDCRVVAVGTHPDLHLIYRQLSRDHPEADVRKRKALTLGVDVFRHFVIDRVGLTASRGRAKVFIIREADLATTHAQNSLLKTLEEPPGATNIILLVTSLDRLLPTTLSRCQVVRFDALPVDFVQAKLTQLKPSLAKEHVAWYARCGEGSIGRVLEQAEDAFYDLNDRLLEGLTELSAAVRPSGKSTSTAGTVRADRLAKIWAEESKTLGDRHKKRDPDISETEAKRRGLKAIFQLAAGWYADVLRLSSAGESAILNTKWHGKLQQAVESIVPRQAAWAVGRIAEAQRQLDLNANAQLCVESLLSELAHVSDGESVAVV